MREVDYVVIGAGSAGCVLAHRLSADPGMSVVVLEAGGDDRPLHEPRQFMSNVYIHLPAGFARTLGNPRVTWGYHTEADEAGRVHRMPRGKVFGGSSSINGMIYVRGLPHDYDGWRQLGLTGWAWSDVLPYFLKAESHVDAASSLAAADQGGPLRISETPEKSELTRAMLTAFVEAGVPHSPDLNGEEREGVTSTKLTAFNGRRWSAAASYLHPVLGRENLRIEKRAIATRIEFVGKRADCVQYVQHGKIHTIRARREILLAAGVIASPQLLQLSGVGDAALLSRLGIQVVLDQPKVGANLQDHYSVGLRARLKPGTITFNQSSRGFALLREIQRWLIHRTGLLANGASPVTAFVRSRPEIDVPDLQFFASPGTFNLQKAAKGGNISLEREPGISFVGYVMRPNSRGTIAIRSPDPSAQPEIRPNYLSDEHDRRLTVDIYHWARRIAAQPALSAYFSHETHPGPTVSDDDALLACAIRSGTTSHHQCGTCAMGTVVDERLRLTGVSGLRVVDASVMPRVVSGNTNAATIMIAEKAADMIIQDSKTEARVVETA